MSGWTHPDYTTRVVVPNGKTEAVLFVEIEGAKEDTEFIGDSFERRPVLRPRLRITSYADRNKPEPITIRARDYTLDEVRIFYGAVAYAWQYDGSAYTLGRRNDNDLPVAYDTATAKQLDALAVAAREAFIADNPGWELRSKQRLFAERINRARSEAARCRAEADEHDAKAVRLTEELTALTGENGDDK